MKKIILIFVTILSVLTVNAQSWDWARGADGSSDDISNCVATDTNGNVYIIGSFKSSTISFGSKTLSNSGNADIFIAKYNSSGNILWATKAGGSLDDVGNGIAVDNNGNVFVTGYFKSSNITLGKHTLNYSGLSGGSLVFIAKFDSSGNSVWAKNPTGTNSNGTADANTGNSIATDNDGNVYVTGGFETTNITFGSITLTNTGRFDMFIVKYDNKGNEKWAKSTDGKYIDEVGKCMVVDNSGNIFLTGYFGTSGSSGLTISFGSVSLKGVSWKDVFIVKYNSSGTALWANCAGGDDDDIGNGICTDNNGNSYIIGQFKSSSIAFDKTTLTNTLNSKGVTTYDVFIAKYSSTGTLVWAKKAAGQGDDFGMSIATYGRKNFLITGHFNGGFILFDKTQIYTGGQADVFIADYDSSGKIISAQSVGNTSNDYCSNICHSGNGNFYLTGNFLSSQISFGNNKITNSGSSDIFVSKYFLDVFPGQVAKPSGQNSLCVNPSNTDYSTSGAKNATSYIWSISPSNAGTISENGLTATVNWNNTFTGTVLITVYGKNDYADGTSSSLSIKINPLPIAAGKISGSSDVCQGQNTVAYTVPLITNATSYVWTTPNGTTGTSISNSITLNFNTSSVSDNISVKGENTCGVGATSSLSINVNPLPLNAGIISGSSNVCQGQKMVTYTVPIITNATSYVWTLPGGATGASTTNAITLNYNTSSVSGNITVKGENTCGEGLLSTFTITVNNKPTTPNISLSGNNLHSNAITGNQWYNQNGLINGATNQDYTVTHNGDYYVMTTLSGCSSDASNIIQIINAGIVIDDKNRIIKVYPNPVVSKELIIEMEGNNEKLNFKILNSIGQIVLEGNLTEKTIIQTASFASGAYLVILENAKIFEFKKISILRN